MSEQNIKTRLQLLTPLYRAFVESDEPAMISQIFAETHGLDETHTLALENGFVLTLLFFLNEAGLASFINKECALPRDQAEQLALALIFALPADIKAAYHQSAERVFPSSATPAPAGNLTTALQAEISEAENLLNTLPPVRTMAGDGQQTVPTYTSTQSALLQEGRLANQQQIPPSQTPTSARWETDK